ncbi:MAG: FtsW/RodA/SpoVE family cell cycle protein, partial [Anaerolineae bacterium]|nr:FtsW/RodA/SpoVE family cell cycle protein [Anaerolineae bacterium]
MKLWRGSRTDWGLLLIVIALVVVGLEMVFSASYGFALSHGEAEARQRVYFFRRQAIFALGGLIALLVFWRIDYRLYRRYAVHILVATVVVLLAMAILGRKVQFGRWVFWKQRSVQPVEAAKVGAIIYIAVWLEARGKDLRNITLGLVPFAVLLGVIAGLVAVQPDFSTAVLLVGTATAMFFVAGADVKQLLIGFLVGGVALALVALAAGYRYVRIVDWWRGPLSDPQGGGFQRVQSLVALNRGHWLGVGLGQSEQKYIIYAPHSDCIFAIIGEEFG